MAKVKSLSAKVLCISHKTFSELLKVLGYSVESFMEDMKFEEAMKTKLEHYKEYVRKAESLKESMMERAVSKSLDISKR